MELVKNAIDFVVLWVDSTDLNWIREKNEWEKRIKGKNQDSDNARYRDWGIFKYWFRCVEKNAPWVRKVHLVTNGQVPDFLDLSKSNIQLDVHSSFMQQDSLPSFNSHAIELQIPYIEDLAEQFVYFNDDIFLINPVEPEHFFREGKRVELFCERSFLRYYDSIFYRIIAKNRKVLNGFVNHKKRSYIKKIGISKWFSFNLPINYWFSNLFYFIFSNSFVGFSIEHGATPLLKSECIDAIKTFNGVFHNTIISKFRSSDEINQYLFRYWSILQGSYLIDRSAGCSFFEIGDIRHIKNGFEKGFKYPMICLNDSSHIKDFDEIKRVVISLFEEYLPNKSRFEK